MTPIALGAVVRGAGRIVEAEEVEPGRLRCVCERGFVFWCYPDEDYISDAGYLILESAHVDDRADEPVRSPWVERERSAA